jgi:hypothetical protein
MRIQDLLEGIFKDEDFVSHNQEGGRELNYDLVEDLGYFMHNDDHAYRRFTFPVIHRFLGLHKKKITPKPSIFGQAVDECYNLYLKQFPIRELPDTIDKESREKLCNKLHEEILEHIASDKYKD